MKIGTENETLEFKKSTGELQSGIVSIAAILNKHGRGELYFGVRNDGVALGLDISDKSLRDVSQAIANHIEPKIFPKINSVVIDDKNCIYISFEGENSPYFAYGRAYLRVADEDRQMTAKELESFILKRNKISEKWDTEISENTIDDIDEKYLSEYLDRANLAGRLEYHYTDKRDILNKLGLVVHKRILNSAKVLFTDPSNLEIQMAIFATEERLTFLDIKRYNGNIFKLIEYAEKFIRNNIRWRVEFDGTLHRKEIPEFPLDAIREALINSFCHRDYRTSQNNEVAIFRNRIEIYNPGIFPEGLNPDDFIFGSERSVKRNPQIAQLLYYSKDVESFGTGLRRINNACNAAGIKVNFQLLKTGFSVVFYRPEIDDNVDSNETPIENTDNEEFKPAKFDNKNKRIKFKKKPIENTVNKEFKSVVSKKVTTKKKVRNKSTEEKSVLQILDYLRSNHFITNKKAREILYISESTVKRLLKKMVDENLIVALGELGQRKYQLKKENTNS